jgi:hypothetical protein
MTKAQKAKARKNHKATGEPTGRPRKKVDARVVEGMATVGATLGEIAEFLEVSHDTIERRFASIIRKSKAGQKIRLRRAQMTSALGDIERGIQPNPTMQIWLGKQILGQQERIATEAPSPESSLGERQSMIVRGKEIFF